MKGDENNDFIPTRRTSHPSERFTRKSARAPLSRGAGVKELVKAHKVRAVKLTRTEDEEQFFPLGKHLGTELRETITNKMIFNILTPQGFKALI